MDITSYFVKEDYLNISTVKSSRQYFCVVIVVVVVYVICLQDSMARRFVPLPKPAHGRLRVYCDLDGVLADFDRGMREVGVSLAELKSNPQKSWATLANTKGGFYRNLHWMEDGKKLWEEIRSYRPIILTGLPRGKWAEPQKRLWCEKHLGRDVVVITCMATEKMQLSAEGNVLIDDTVKNCRQWTLRGGNSIIHTSASDSSSKLKELYDKAGPIKIEPPSEQQPTEETATRAELEQHIARLEAVLRTSGC